MSVEAIEKDTRFCLKESNIENAGLGLYAKEKLSKGSRLEVTGVLVNKNSPGELCTRYARDYRFFYSEEQILVPTGWAGMANHASRFNAVLIKIEDKLYLEMLRDITEDEEIVFEYSTAAMLKMNMQSSGQAFAVVCEKQRVDRDITAQIKLVTVNLAKAMRKVESLKQQLGEGWDVNVVPTKIDLQELKGTLN